MLTQYHACSSIRCACVTVVVASIDTLRLRHHRCCVNRDALRLRRYAARLRHRCCCASIETLRLRHRCGCAFDTLRLPQYHRGCCCVNRDAALVRVTVVPSTHVSVNRICLPYFWDGNVVDHIQSLMHQICHCTVGVILQLLCTHIMHVSITYKLELAHHVHLH